MFKVDIFSVPVVSSYAMIRPSEGPTTSIWPVMRSVTEDHWQQAGTLGCVEDPGGFHGM